MDVNVAGVPEVEPFLFKKKSIEWNFRYIIHEENCHGY